MAMASPGGDRKRRAAPQRYPEPGHGRGWLQDIVALVGGGMLFLAAFAIAVAAAGAWDGTFCSGEWRPFLGSGRQAFAVRGCLLRDAGPLIGIKKALRIYDPGWKTVIK